jgi:hypothetical protein
LFRRRPTLAKPHRLLVLDPLALVYAPQHVRSIELGIVGFSVTVAAAHIFVLKMAQRAH